MTSDATGQARAASGTGRLKPQTSVYLDICRLLAVLLVFLSHAKRPAFGSDSVALATLGQYGQEGVAYFFVISGLVIGHVVSTREKRLGTYAVARLSRLWSVVLPAIILTILLDSIGRAVDPTLYADPLIPAWGFDLKSLWQAVAPALFLNKIPGLDVEVGSNGPFWSLCYEAWYYAGFAAIVFLRTSLWIRIAVLTVLAAIAGSDILSLAPIWLLGNLLYHRLGRASPSVLAWIAWLASSAAIPLLMLTKYAFIRKLSGGGIIAAPAATDIAEKYLPAVLLAINLLSFDAISPAFRGVLRRARRPVRFLVNRSFSVYLYQAPVLFIFGALTQAILPRRLAFGLVVAGALAAILLIAEVTERKRPVLAGWLTTVWGMLRQTRPVAEETT